MEDNKKRSSRKRKFEDTHNHNTKGALLLDTEEEEEDDEKVEEFFALIRSTREVRHRLRTSKDRAHQDQDPNNNNNNSSIVGVWNPTFRPEDFLDLVHRDRGCDDVCPGGTSSGQQSTSRMEVEMEKNKLVASDGGNNINNNNNNNNINSMINLDLKLSL